MTISATNRNQAQAYLLGSNRDTVTGANASFTLTATAATDCVIDDVIVNASGSIGNILDNGFGVGQTMALVTDVRLSGQSFVASNGGTGTDPSHIQGFPIAGFNPAGKLDGVRSLGASIAKNDTFELELTSAAPTSPTDPVSFTASTAPLAPGTSPISPNNLPPGVLSYIFPFGKMVITPGATQTFTATCLRDNIVLGRLVASAAINAAPDFNASMISITSIKADGIELLTSRSPTLQPIGINACLASASDAQGLVLNWEATLNSQISIEVRSDVPGGGQNVIVAFGCFCRPFKLDNVNQSYRVS